MTGFSGPPGLGFSGKPVPGSRLSLQGGSSVFPRGSDAGTSRGRAGISEIQAPPRGNRHLHGRQRNRSALNHERGPSSLRPPPGGPAGRSGAPRGGGFQPRGGRDGPPGQMPRKCLPRRRPLKSAQPRSRPPRAARPGGRSRGSHGSPRIPGIRGKGAKWGGGASIWEPRPFVRRVWPQNY